MVSPSSALAAVRKEGLSKVKVATPVEPSRDRVSFTSGTHGSGTPMMNSMYAAGAPTAIEGHLLTKDRTPFAFYNYDDYEELKGK